MSWLRGATLALGLGLLLTPLGTARAAADPPRRSRDDRPGQWGLMSPYLQERLGLTARQKEKIAKLQDEFADKSKDSQQAGRKLLAKAIEDGDWEAFHEKTRAHIEATMKQYAEYHDKLLAVLTEDQKEKYEALMPLPGFARPWARSSDQERKPERTPAASSDLEKKLDRLIKETEELRREIRRSR